MLGIPSAFTALSTRERRSGADKHGRHASWVRATSASRTRRALTSSSGSRTGPTALAGRGSWPSASTVTRSRRGLAGTRATGSQWVWVEADAAGRKVPWSDFRLLVPTSCADPDRAARRQRRRLNGCRRASLDSVGAVFEAGGPLIAGAIAASERRSLSGEGATAPPLAFRTQPGHVQAVMSASA